MDPGAQGTLDTGRPLPEHMSSLARNRATGALAARTGDARRTLIFVRGEMRAATSTREDEKLGLWLVNRDRIRDDERALALLAQGGSDPLPLGLLLVRRGTLDNATLEYELEELTLAILRRAAAAADGDCEFCEGVCPDQPDTLPNLTTTEAILIAAREVTDGEAKLRAVGSLDQVAWPASALDTLLDELRLTPTEAFVLSRLDGTRRLHELLVVSPMPRDQVISTLYALRVAGIVQLGTTPLHPLAAPPMPAMSRRRLEESPPGIDESRLSPEQRRERTEIRDLAQRLARLDHYRALGLRGAASAGVVRQAWEAMRRKFAPERSAEPHLRDLRAQLSAILERAQEAYEIISNPAACRRYDAILESIEREEQGLATERVERRGPDQQARRELVEANFRRAEELEREGEFYLAIRLLEHACGLEPRPDQLLRLARLLLRNPLWANRALEAVRQAVHLDPSLVEGWVELAEFWRRRNNPERQRKALERALRLAPDEPRAAEMYERLLGRRELQRFLRMVGRETH